MITCSKWRQKCMRLKGSPVITRDEMIGLLLKADPSLQSAWDEYLEDHGDLEQPLLYLALAEFARSLKIKLQSQNTERFPEIFEVVERWHIEGDKFVRTAATVGLLEDLQNEHEYTTGRPDDFIRWLKPTTLRFWQKVEAFWRDGTLITDD